jgi:hypothetical protein
MHMSALSALGAAGAAALLVTAREAFRRFFVRYEYRFDSFSVLGPFGRQLFQIRQSEIESLTPARLGERLGEARTWPRSQFAPKVVIRARMARRPVVISWEGLPIAGLTPQGFKQRSPSRGKRR